MSVETKNIASLFALGSVLFSHIASADPGSYGGGYGYGHGMMGYGGFGFIGGLITLALVIGAAVLAVRWFGGNASNSSSEDAALRTLRERFARGDIDEQEYQQRKQALNG